MSVVLHTLLQEHLPPRLSKLSTRLTHQPAVGCRYPPMSRPLRVLLPKADHREQPPTDPTEPSEFVEPPRKRKLVELACHWCRAHKTKCDGGRPSCGTCRHRNKQCEYDDDPDTTPHANLKRQYRQLVEQQQEFTELFEMLRSRPEQEANVILQQLRKSGNVRSTLHFIKEGYLLVNGRSSNAVPDGFNFRGEPVSPTELMLGASHPHAYPILAPVEAMQHELGPKRKSILNADPTQDESITAEDIRNARTLDRPHQVCDARLLRIDVSQWTSVTDQTTSVANLISMYLSWDHATLRLFDEELFLDHIVAGETAYCSPALVNALLAAACLNYGAVDKQSCARLGPRFYDEAVRRFAAEEDRGPHILLVPTAALLCMWCESVGQHQTSSKYIDKALGIAHQLELYSKLPREAHLCDAYSRRMLKAEAIVAWGFYMRQVVDVYFRRGESVVPDTPNFPISYEAESLNHDGILWNSFPFRRDPQMLYRDVAFKVYADLLMIIWEGEKARQAVSGPEVLEASFQVVKNTHESLLKWAGQLPEVMVRDSRSLPPVFDLHLFFHGAVVQMFRPFAHADFVDQSVAKEIMLASMSQMRRILYIQRYQYDGPPFSSATAGSFRVFTSEVLEQLARSEGVDNHARFYLILAAEEMKRYGQGFPLIHKAIHELLNRSLASARVVPHEVGEMFRQLDSRLTGHLQLKDFPSEYPIEFKMGISRPSGSVYDELMTATYNLTLRDEDGEGPVTAAEANDEESSSRNKGKGKETCRG